MADFSGALSPILSSDLVARRGMASPSLSSNVFDSTAEVHKEAIARPHVEILSESQIKGPTSISNEVASVKGDCIHKYILECMLLWSHTHNLHDQSRGKDHGGTRRICHVVLE